MIGENGEKVTDKKGINSLATEFHSIFAKNQITEENGDQESEGKITVTNEMYEIEEEIEPEFTLEKVAYIAGRLKK